MEAEDFCEAGFWRGSQSDASWRPGRKRNVSSFCELRAEGWLTAVPSPPPAGKWGPQSYNRKEIDPAENQ